MNVKKEKKSQQSLKKTNEKKKQPLPMQKVKKEMHKIEVRDPSYVSEDMKLQLASQIMTPERSQSGNAIMSPSETPSVSQAAHFRIVKIIPNPSSDYTLTVKPTLTPLSVTTSQQYEVSTLFFNAYIGGSGALEGLAFDADFNDDSSWTVTAQVHSCYLRGQSNFFPIDWLSDGGSNGNFKINTHGFVNGEFEIDFLYSNGTILTPGSFVAQQSADNGIYQCEVSNLDSNPVIGFRIRALPGSYSPQDDSSTFVEFAPNCLTSTSTSSHVALPIDIPLGTERYRITSLAAKVTFFGSDIYNEGGVAVARTYPGWSPFSESDDAFSNIANLPYQSYNGRVSEGAHAFWVPSDLNELDWRDTSIPYNDDLALTRLWFATKGLDPAGTFRVELDMVVEFYNPKPYFDKNVNPYLSDGWRKFYFDLAHSLCVGDNPNHLARLAKIGRTVAKGVATAGQIAAMFI